MRSKSCYQLQKITNKYMRCDVNVSLSREIIFILTKCIPLLIKWKLLINPYHMLTDLKKAVYVQSKDWICSLDLIISPQYWFPDLKISSNANIQSNYFSRTWSQFWATDSRFCYFFFFVFAFLFTLLCFASTFVLFISQFFLAQ